ncbi:C40 family peptidase [Lysobacter sp. Root494]|uniref:C40 family peptidase n=1 Tax=Lysobacter sp. Root494 TaxID=1736549 RepID=UPI001F280518|nr:C40 family peptidase [Lysobacter sp. Root494]
MTHILLAAALFTPAATVFAAPIDDAAPFPTRAKAAAADIPAPARTDKTPQALASTRTSPTLSDRALGLAAGVNRFLSPALALDLPAEAIGTPVAEDSKVKTVLQKALALLGTPYRWGGADPDKGFDCSGLVGYVFRNALGIELPRVSRDMARSGELVTDRAKLAAGDLVFFGRKGRVNHVGIYVGDGRFVHAPSRGKDVTVSSLDQGYWSGRFLQARRVSADGT